MNGAAAVPDSKIKALNKRSISKIGSSHHFLFSLRKPQTSATKLSPVSEAAAASKSSWGLPFIVNHSDLILVEIAARLGGGLRRPVGRRAGFKLAAEGVAPEQ